MKVKNSMLEGNNQCVKKREKDIPLISSKNVTYDLSVFQKKMVVNAFLAKQIRITDPGMVYDAIFMIQNGEKREDVPSELLPTFDAVKSILSADGQFDLRTGEFDATKAYVTCLLAARPKYIEATVKRRYTNGDFFFDTKESGRINGEEAAARILRYLNDEQRSLIANPKPREIDLFEMLDDASFGVLEDTVRPDLLWIDERTRSVETIQIRTRKSFVSTKGRSRDHNTKNNKKLYGLYAYARMEARKRGWPEANAKGSFYFLKKEADRPTEGYLEPGYFGSKNMKHIASLTSPFPGLIDSAYREQFEKFAVGEVCDGEDCEKCDNFQFCHFAESPLVAEAEPVATSPKAVKLSATQKKIVAFRNGVMCVIAGAGAGKTQVLVTRICMMALEMVRKGLSPEKALETVLAITFSRAAAMEVKRRIKTILKAFGIEVDTTAIHSMTFNEFGQRILDVMYAEVGFSAPPRPIDDTERHTLVRDVLNKSKPIPGLYYQNINAGKQGGAFKGARLVCEEAFSVIKRDRLSAYDVETLKAGMTKVASSISDDAAYPAMLELYDAYEEEMRSRNLIEFQDQESLIFDVMDVDPYYLDKLGYKHVVIDEFQDTSENQMEIVKKMKEVAGFESLLVVGDDSQGIYGWRNARIENLLNFSEEFDDVEVIYLVENYRSTPEIIGFANGVDRLNKGFKKELKAMRPSNGKPVLVKGFHKVAKEDEFIVKTVQEKLDEGYAPEDIAILARTKAEVVRIAGKLAEAGIEVSMQAPQPMLKNSRVQGIISLAKGYKDITATKEILVFQNCLNGGNVMDLPEDEILGLIEEGRNIVLAMRGSIEPQKSNLFKNLADEIAGDDDIAADFAERLDRFVTLKQIIEYIEAFERFDGEELKRVGSYNGVVCSTAHSSKGLEWPVVINSVTKYDRKDGMGYTEREEQRRLLFVSATRARDELFITGQVRLAGNAEDGYAINQFLEECSIIADQPLDYDDAEGRKEREAKAAVRKAKLVEEKKAKAGK